MVLKWIVVLMMGVMAAMRVWADPKEVLGFDAAVDVGLQRAVEGLDARLREKLGMTEAQTAVGVMDLNSGRVALVRGDREEYAASVAKIGILLAYFEAHPEAKIVTTGIRIIDQHGRTLVAHEDWKQKAFTSALLPNILRNRFQGSAMAFRASLRELVLPFPKRKIFLHDAWIGICNRMNGGEAIYIDEPLLYYRRHGNNFSGKLSIRLQIAARLQLLLALIRRFVYVTFFLRR